MIPFSDAQVSSNVFVSPAIYSVMGGHVHYAPEYDRCRERLVPLCGSLDGGARVSRLADFLGNPILTRCPTCQTVVVGIGACLLELLR